jgi:hypothetical protein
MSASPEMLPTLTRGRRIGITALLVSATLVWTVGALGVWAKRQVLDNNNWVDTSSELLGDEPIRTAVGLYLVDHVWETDAVEQRLVDALPPRLDPLAPQAAAALKQVAERNAPRVLGSAAALKAWEKANSAAQRTFKEVIEGDVAAGGTVTLDLKDLLGQVAPDLGLPPDVTDKLPSEVAQLEVFSSDDLEAAQTAMDVFKTLAIALVLLALVLFALAVYLSSDRRRTLLSVGACIAVAGLLILVIRRLGTDVVVNALAKSPTGEDAVENVWLIGTSLLAEVGQGSLLGGVILISGTWLSGPGRWATSLRRVSAPTLRDNPAAARVALGVLLLLLMLWHPVPWTGRFFPLLILAIAAFGWLEWLRHRAAEEFPEGSDAPVAPAVSNPD